MLVTVLIMMSHMMMMMKSCNAIVFLPQTVHVKFINDLKGYQTLKLHCKSKNDDLGLKVIPSGGVWEFKFKTNFWGNTRFFCKVEWAGNLHYFDAYIDDRDSCTQCLWSIKNQNPCQLYADRTLCFKWNQH